MRVTDEEYAAMCAALRQPRPAARPAMTRCRPVIAAGALAVVLVIACAVAGAGHAAPVRHHRAVAARCTVTAPCRTRAAGPLGKALTAYALVRTARGLVRMPVRAARAYLRLQAARAWPGTGAGGWVLPSARGDGG